MINYETANKNLKNSMDQVNRLLNINQKSAVEELFKKVNESGVLYAL